MASDPPKVFISYSHDSPEHAQHVLELAERLRKDGVDAQIDQYIAGTPAGGWPRWMLHSRCCTTSVIRRLLPIRNSLPSTSALSYVTPKVPRRRQATLRKFASQNTGLCIPFEGNSQFRS